MGWWRLTEMSVFRTEDQYNSKKLKPVMMVKPSNKEWSEGIEGNAKYEGMRERGKRNENQIASKQKTALVVPMLLLEQGT
jgi:hypothetical protein